MRKCRAAGELAEITDDVRVLTGRPPITLRDYLTNSAG
jgi:hypothetical protein